MVSHHFRNSNCNQQRIPSLDPHEIADPKLETLDLFQDGDKRLLEMFSLMFYFFNLMFQCDLPVVVWRTYTWGLPHAKNLPAVVNFVHHPKILKPAPRFDGDAFQVDSARCGQCGRNMLRRLLEYSFFYKKHPKSSWWGWKFFGHRN